MEELYPGCYSVCQFWLDTQSIGFLSLKVRLLSNRNAFLATEFITGCDSLPSFAHRGETVLGWKEKKFSLLKSSQLLCLSPLNHTELRPGIYNSEVAITDAQVWRSETKTYKKEMIGSLIVPLRVDVIKLNWKTAMPPFGICSVVIVIR